MKIYKVLNRANYRKITLRQLMLLINLCDDELTPTEITKSLDISGAAVTLLVDKLEKLGYVERSHTRSDRRKILINITPTGREICDSIIKAI